MAWYLSRTPKKNSLHYNPPLVVEYLVSLSSLSLQHLNVVRSAIASVYQVVHAQEPSLGNHALVQQFFKARKRTRSKLPNRNQEIFDIDLKLVLVENWGATKDLPLDKLQKKTLVLLTIATMWRPRSDLGNLQHRDVTFVEFEGKIIGATLAARQPKASKIGITMSENLCPVKTLHAFIQRMSHIRHDLEDDHTFFLANIVHDKYGAQSIRPKTVSVWLEEIMKMEGIDTTRFKAHSLRSASSTKAAMTGVPIENIKLHANWSLNNSAFEDYYYRPGDQHTKGAMIVDMVFGNVTKKITASEAGLEATAIVGRTYHNCSFYL